MAAGRLADWMAHPPHALPQTIAHRGASGEFPENTIRAFAEAKAQGADVFEFDIWRSRDGVWFVFHDETLNRLTDGRGPITAQSAEDLEALDAAHTFQPPGDFPPFPFRGQGIGIPRLSEVMQAFPDTKMIIEIKESSAEAGAALASFLTDYPDADQRVVVGSFHRPTLSGFRAAAPHIPTGASAPEVRNFYLASRLGLSGFWPVAFDALQIPHHSGGVRVAHRRLIAAAERRGIPVQVWTVNDAGEMAVLLERGVDALITDFPARSERVIREMFTHLEVPSVDEGE